MTSFWTHRVTIAAISAAAFRGVVSAAHAQSPYGWSISASSTDPDANSTAVQDFAMYYLWLKCSTAGGVQAAQFGMSTGDPDVHACVVPANGWLNAGSPMGGCLLLAAPGCPTGSLVVATIVVSNCSLAPFSLCLIPCDPFGGTPKMVTVDCATTTENPMDWVGLDVGGGFCGSGSICGTVSREAMTWGRAKNDYR